jgi:WD40 repeat protein
MVPRRPRTVNGTVRLWDAPSGRVRATLEGHTGVVWSVAVSGDGRLVATGTWDGPVRLWETRSGRLLATLQGHLGAVWSVAVSRDGRLVASGSDDGMTRLWEVGSGSCLHSLRSDRHYQRVDITGSTGVTEAQRAVLLALGPVEHGSASAAH